MMKSLTVRRRNPWTGESLGALTFDPNSEYRMRNIDGLGPVKATIAQAPRAGGPGSLFLNSKDEARNIVLTYDNLPTYSNEFSTVSNVRQYTSHVLAVGSEIEMEFELDDKYVSISGYVESNETPMFAKESRSTVSIICTHPYFKLVGDPTVIPWADAEATITFDYEGRNLAPVGFVFESSVTSLIGDPQRSIWLYSRTDMGRNPGSLLIVQGAYTWAVGDKFIFSTIRGERRVQYLGAEGLRDLLGFLNGSLSEFQIVEGTNTWQFAGAGPKNNTTISYTPEFKSI